LEIQWDDIAIPSEENIIANKLWYDLFFASLKCNEPVVQTAEIRVFVSEKLMAFQQKESENSGSRKCDI